MAGQAVNILGEKIRHKLKTLFPQRVVFDAPMWLYTTMRTGGTADALVTPASQEEVGRLVQLCQAEGIPWMVMGRGSNLLVLDGGIRGVVIRMGPPMEGIHEVDRQGEEVLLRVDAGTPIRRLLGHCLREGLTGPWFLAGIPGTIGGGLVMNAGAQDGSISDVIHSLMILLPEGRTQVMKGASLRFSYRHLDLPEGGVILCGTLALKRVRERNYRWTVEEEMRKRMRARITSQPLDKPSCGSVFKNPPGDAAGRIIDSLGLKGLRVGGAEVSTVHANFIVNLGDASSADVLTLIRLVQGRVLEETGLNLELEVRIVGEEG